MELFLSTLKNIKLVFRREVSEINKNVAKEPVTGQAILDQLNKRYNMLIRKEGFKMEQGLDTIGEHFVPVTYANEEMEKEFTFFVKVQIEPTVRKAPKAEAASTTSKSK